METSVQKRLRFQNEVMKWLTELSDDFSSESSSLDFSHLLGPKQATFSAIKFGSESSDAIFSDVFGAPQGQTEKAC
ncbi:hypothetical protein C5167_039366 [Papaver somniferum]|uniref:Uncharacterized protein n=1 Tax=Papaver somniferum TaxID=3469 RepID=A0A4Y7IED7_PAPSO|nr:hypothetical protein C5167_039366 [Papaver somniferum]